MSLYPSPCEPFFDDSTVGGHILTEDLRRPVGVIGVCGLSEFGGVYVATLYGLWVGGPSFHSSGGDVDGCCEEGFWGGWSSLFVGQGLVHVFLG